MSCGWCHEGRCTTPSVCEKSWRSEIPPDPWPPDPPDPPPLVCPECGGTEDCCDVCADLDASCSDCGCPLSPDRTCPTQQCRDFLEWLDRGDRLYHERRGQ